jgi:hypothetical protein
MDNGEWIVGYPFETWNYRRTERVAYMALNNPCEVHADGAIMNLRAVMIDPATLGYATGKLDKNKEMIYGGMEVWFVGEIREVHYEDCRWKIVVELRKGNRLEGDLWTCKSENLEIVRDGE